MRQVHALFSIVAAALLVVVLSGCGRRDDLGGKATLKVSGDTDPLFFTLSVFVNGQEVPKGGRSNFEFDNRKDGNNELKVRTTLNWTGEKNDTTFSFKAMPGSVTRVTLKQGFGFQHPTYTADISTESQGFDPVQVAKENARKAEEDAREAARRAKEEGELDAELRKFAKEFVPDLQQAIDKYEEQARQFTEQRAAFARDMAKLDVDPNTRPAYGRQGEIIEKMRQDSQRLLADRKETYIRWKELSLLRDTPDTKEQRERLLQSAQKAAKAAEATFARYMEQSLAPDPK